MKEFKHLRFIIEIFYKNNKMDIIKLPFEFITGDQYTKSFRETFSDITFTGMLVNEAIQILKSRGYNNYRIYKGTKFLTKIFRREVILYTDEFENKIIREPDYY